MDIECPYLQAIQSIAGNTPGEKQRTLHDIASRIARADSPDAESQILDVPEAMKPVVRIEVAKILHRYEGIIEALKSEDLNVVSRALQAKWFFDGSDSSLVNARYFMDNVFPEISLYARFKIVKNLGSYLRNTKVAADFFLALTERYGVDQAVPLLEVCDEDFAFKMIIENKIILSLRMVRLLYRKYPNLIVKYLMLSKPDDEEARNLYRIDVRDYEAFLPEVGNTRFEDFMEIYSMHDGLNVKLGKKGAKTFVKTRMNLLIEKPDRYLKLLSLKLVTQKLRDDEFKKMFKNLFPAEEEAFSYSTLNEYLQYYKPDQDKMPLMLSTFREVYGKDLLSCKDLINHEVMKALPASDRVNQAKLKLQDDKDWHLYNPENSWRCYLPTSESIPAITKKILHCSDASTRGQFLDQMIYTSKVNDDKDALLGVLNYVYDRHRNDQKWVFYNYLSKISNSFDLAKLSSAHWEVLNKYVRWAEVQGDLCDQTDTMSRVIGAGLHYRVLNNLPLDDYVRIFVDMQLPVHYGVWNILTEHPDLDKKFLDLFIETIPKQYPFENKIWKDREPNVIMSIAGSLWDFNKRNRVSNGKFQKLSVTDYPWLLEKTKAIVMAENDGYDFWIEGHLKLLKENERELYYTMIRDLEKFWTFDAEVIFDVMKKHPQRVIDNWKECLEKLKNKVYLERRPTLIITKSRWYQLLPINFFTESLKTYNDVEPCVGSVVILALLADGKTYAKIIEPFIPDGDTIDVDDPKAKNIYSTLLAILLNLRKLNPPVPLDTIAKFCVGDYLQTAIQSLTSVCRRVPVVKVIPFAETLVNRPVSVMKHGIRLMYLVAPLEEIYTYLTNLWNSEGHTSIRSVVFTKIYDLFRKQPDSRSWRMILTCLNNLHANDDEELFKKLTKLSLVPNEYLYEYIKSVLNVMESMKQKSKDSKIYVNISCQLIKNIDGPVTRILPEDYSQDLIKKYLFVFDYDSEIFQTGMGLTINSYLLSSKKYNESRFKFFGDFFRYSVQEYWNKTHPKCCKFYPVNHMVRKFFGEICSSTNDDHDLGIFESLLEIFQSVLKPHQDSISYLDLVYSIEYHKSQTSVDFGTRIAQKIPELITIFSPECVIFMSNRLLNFLRNRSFSKSESNDEKLMAIIEVFSRGEAIHCAFFAANMLFSNTSKRLNERHATVVHSLRNLDHPGVASFLNERLARFEFSADSDN